jgi:hypothetical protein
LEQSTSANSQPKTRSCTRAVKSGIYRQSDHSPVFDNPKKPIDFPRHGKRSVQVPSVDGVQNTSDVEHEIPENGSEYECRCKNSRQIIPSVFRFYRDFNALEKTEHRNPRIFSEIVLVLR